MCELFGASDGFERMPLRSSLAFGVVAEKCVCKWSVGERGRNGIDANFGGEFGG